MPAHNIELKDPLALGRLLMAIVLANGKELRIKACDYDSIDTGRLLLVDFDRETGDLVLRATSGYGRALVVQPESHQWTLPLNEAPLERQRTEAAKVAARRAVPSDEDLADLESKAQERQNLAKLEEEGKVPLRIRTRPPS